MTVVSCECGVKFRPIPFDEIFVGTMGNLNLDGFHICIRLF